MINSTRHKDSRHLSAPLSIQAVISAKWVGCVSNDANNMSRTPNEYAVYLLMESGHREEVRFPTFQDFQKWYSGALTPKSDSNDFINVPIKNIQGEYMVVRPSRIVAIRVEPIFSSSVERFT
ncbi:hypothetical protein PCC6912_45950 [Chlorogloeopsis fritschii PCC 6912]|uniref:Uncharacterized protein n=2 Tax=Chlorogloeopsis fritschii TaxID=1124 RepID=A0A3S0Y3D3_CHLFR|nr:hypothetical protein PCC6912_45950 [Chlorogloeopsis fritschii PCC 6912]